MVYKHVNHVMVTILICVWSRRVSSTIIYIELYFGQNYIYLVLVDDITTLVAFLDRPYACQSIYIMILMQIYDIYVRTLEFGWIWNEIMNSLSCNSLKWFLYDGIGVIFYMGAVGAKFTWRGPLFNYISRILNNALNHEGLKFSFHD